MTSCRWALLRPSALAALLLATAMSLGACAGSAGNEVKRTTDLPRGFYTGIAWLPEEGIIVGFAPPSASANDFRLSRLDDSAGALQQIDLPFTRSGCAYVGQLHPALLGSGNLGYLETCGKSLSKQISRLVEHSFESGGTTELVTLPFAPARYSWSGDRTELFVSNSDEICGGIARWNGTRLEPLKVPVGPPKESFLLSEAFVDAAKGDCRDSGLADWPAVSHRDGAVAFVASHEAIGLAGQARTAASWNLYLLDVQGSTARALVKGLYHPRSLAWSPLGDAIAFSAEIEDEGSGTWIYDLEGGQLEQINPRQADWLAWDASGQNVALLAVDSELNAEFEVVARPSNRQTE